MRLMPLFAALPLALGSCSGGFDTDWAAVLLAARYSSPQGWSVSASLLPGDPDKGAVFYQVEPGTSAGKLAVGYVKGGLETYLGMQAIKVTIMRTWGEPGFSLAPDQTIVGLEYQYTYLHISLVCGAFVRTSGDAPGDEQAFSAGVGFGF